MNNHKSSRIPPLGAVLLLFVLVFSVYANSLGNGFFLDDYTMLLHDPFIRDFHNLPHILSYAADSREEIKHFRPVSIVLRMVLFHFFKDNPFPYHLVNVFLFGIYAALFFMSLVLLSGDVPLSLTAAALFCVHPVNHIPVDFVTGHEILLMGIFSALTVIGFTRYLKNHAAKGAYIASVLFFGLSLLTQETSVLLPVFLFALSRIVFRNGRRLSLGYCLPYLSLVAGLIALKIILAGDVLAFLRHDAMRGFAIVPYFFSLLRLLGWYVSRLVFPVDIVFIWSALDKSPDPGWTTVAGLLAAAGLMVAVSRRGRRDLARLGLVWFGYGFLILPLLCFVYFSAMGLIIEPHWFFFTSGGFFLMTALMSRNLPARFPRGGRAAVVVVVGMIWGALTAYDNTLWASGAKYATYWLGRVPHNPYALRFLGHDAMRQGRLDQAEAYFRKILDYGVDRRVYLELSRVYLLKGNEDAAERTLREGIRKMPDESTLVNDLGTLTYQRGRPEEALRLFRKARTLDPKNIMALKNIADTFMSLKQWDAAVPALKEALARVIYPWERKALLAKLAVVYFMTGDMNGSAAAWEGFVKEGPRPADWTHFARLCFSVNARDLGIKALETCMGIPGEGRTECRILYRQLHEDASQAR